MAEDMLSTFFFLGFWLVLMLFYPRMMLSQTLWKLEQTANDLEKMSVKARKIVISEISKSPSAELKNAMNRLVEFFAIEPVSLDPYGIVKKIEHITDYEEEKLRYYVREIAPRADAEKQANLLMGLAGAMQVHQIAKVVRHFVEIIKKTKNLQLAMVLQMQLPMVEKIARAVYKGTGSLARGEPLGDSVGPLVVAKLIGDAKTKEIAEDTLYAKTRLMSRSIIIMKARGPGGRLGKLGKGAEKIIETQKITRIITIDAAAKLEGEKTGSVAEGVGVAIGGLGVEKSYIENLAVRKNIPLDSILIKMSQEEAITPMPKSVKDSYDVVIENLNRVLKKSKPSERILLVGVGNTSGVGNSGKDAKKAEEFIEKENKKTEKEKKKRKSERGFLSKLSGKEEDEF